MANGSYTSVTIIDIDRNDATSILWEHNSNRRNTDEIGEEEDRHGGPGRDDDWGRGRDNGDRRGRDNDSQEEEEIPAKKLKLERGDDMLVDAVAGGSGREEMIPVNKDGKTSGGYDDDRQKNFEEYMMGLKWMKCEKCKEKVLRSEGSVTKCTHRKSCAMYSAENNMDPGDVPDVLKNLSYIEQQLIARVHTTISVYKIRGRQTGYSGNVINFPQDVNEVAKKLPRRISDVKTIISIRTKNERNYAEFRVRAKVVKDALVWKKKYDKYYYDAEIDDEALQELPEDGNVEDKLDNIEGYEEGEEENEDETEQEKVDDGCREEECQIEESCVFNPEIPRNEEQVEQFIEWPTIGSSPLSEFKTDGYMSMAFPCLFPTGEACLNDKRKHKITPSNYFKHLMRYHDSRFVKHSTFRFFAMNTIMRWRALTDGNVFVSKSEVELRNCTVKDLKEKVQQDKKFLQKSLFYGSNIAGSSPFWRSRYQEVRVLPKQLGKAPTLYVTLSAADYHWPDLYRVLCDDEEPVNITERDRRRLMEDDPVTVNMFFMMRVEAFMQKVVIPHFEVEDYWYRIEYQHRGSPHIHSMLWLKNAPDMTKIPEMNLEELDHVINFLNKLVVAVHPNVSEPPAIVHPCRRRLQDVVEDGKEQDLAELLNHVQRHTKCSTSYCLRAKKFGQPPRCRFGFPMELRESSGLEENVENRRIEFLPARNDPLLNKCNPYISRVWRANTDVSAITSLEALEAYLVKYLTKKESKSQYLNEIANLVFQKCTDDDRAVKFIQKILIKTCCDRDYSAQEVGHFLLSLPYHSCSRSFVTINFSSLTKRSVTREGSCRASSILEKYAVRKAEFENRSLWQMAKHYMLPSGRKRSKAAVVLVYPKLREPVVKEERSEYYMYQCLLHIPWRDLDKVINDETSWYDCYQGIAKDVVHCSLESVTERLNEIEEEPEEEHVANILTRSEWMQVAAMGPNQRTETVQLGMREVDYSFSFDWVGRREEYLQEGTPSELRCFLQEKRSDILACCSTGKGNLEEIRLTRNQEEVLNVLRVQIAEIRSSNEQEIVGKGVPKRIIVQGKAGTGKSVVIRKMVEVIATTLHEDNLLLLAPTGVAALNINGCTLCVHSRFHIVTDNI